MDSGFRREREKERGEGGEYLAVEHVEEIELGGDGGDEEEGC